MNNENEIIESNNENKINNNDNKPNIDENIKISDEDITLIERKDYVSYKFMKVKNNIKAKEPIQIEINIPKCIQKRRKENHIIRRILKLNDGKQIVKLK